MLNSDGNKILKKEKDVGNTNTGFLWQGNLPTESAEHTGLYKLLHLSCCGVCVCVFVCVCVCVCTCVCVYVCVCVCVCMCVCDLACICWCTVHGLACYCCCTVLAFSFSVFFSFLYSAPSSRILEVRT